MREMINTGNDCLSLIPKDWSCPRLKFHCLISNGSDPQTEGDIPVYGSGQEPVKFCGEFKEGPAILLGRKGTLDKPKYVEGKFWNVDTAMDAYPVNINPRYLFLITTILDIKRYATCTAKPSMTQSDYYNMPIPLPPPGEQSAIVSYLDKKCAAIDEAIARRRQIIEKLEEYRMSKIADLVLLRDSHDRYETGNIWFETMPAGIKISSIKRHFSVKLGKMLCSSARDENDTLEPYYCAGDVHFDGMNYSDLKRMWFSQAEKKLNEVRNGDLLIVEGGAGAGGAFIVSQQVVPTYIQNSILRVRGTKTGSVRYLKYLIEHLVKNGYIGYACNTATFAHYTNDKVSDTPFPAIPIEIQEKIADELDSIDRGVQKLKTVNSQAIEKLEEYRKSIIYNAVTGKIDCREAV